MARQYKRDARGRFASTGGGGGRSKAAAAPGKGKPAKGTKAAPARSSGLQWGKKQNAMYQNPADARSDRKHFEKKVKAATAKETAIKSQLAAAKANPPGSKERRNLAAKEAELQKAKQTRAETRKAVEAANAKLAETRTRKAALAARRGSAKPAPPAWNATMAAAAGRGRKGGRKRKG